MSPSRSRHANWWHASAPSCAAPRLPARFPIRDIAVWSPTAANAARLAATLAGAPLTLGHFGTASWGGVFVNLVLVPLSEIPLMLGMASVACSPIDWLAGPASWINGFAGAWLHGMTWIAQACAALPGLNLELSLPRRWLGPVGGALLAATFLAQAQSKSLRRLLGVPAAVLAAWLLLAFL